MPYYAPQPMPVTCPQCKAQFVAPVFTILDAKDMPQEVELFILGMLNVFTCPRCGAPLAASVPLFYHNAEKQLAYIFIPPQVNLSPEQRQQIIGDLTRAVMRDLPQDHPKGYLLQPREFLSLDNMREAVMEAHGIRKEDVEARKQKFALVDQLLRLMDDPIAFAAAVGKHKEQFDAEFFALLRGLRDNARALGREEEAQRFETLRQKLLPHSPAGRREAAYDKAIAFLRGQPDRKALLKALLEAQDEEEIEALTRVARPLADYRFFQMVTEQIQQKYKAGQKEEARRLERLRDRVLNITQQVDREAQELLEERANLLRTILSAEDIEQAVREHMEEIDDVFFFLLQSELETAHRRGLKEVVERLSQVWEAIRRVSMEGVPPELQFIETLLTLRYPDETQRFLEEHRDALTPELLTLMNALAEDLERQGMKEDAKRLRGIRAQAMGLLSQVSR